MLRSKNEGIDTHYDLATTDSQMAPLGDISRKRLLARAMETAPYERSFAKHSHSATLWPPCFDQDGSGREGSLLPQPDSAPSSCPNHAMRGQRRRLSWPLEVETLAACSVQPIG